MTSPSPSPSSAPSRLALMLQLLRALGHLIAVASVTLWGFLAWSFPFPALLTGIGFLVLSAVLWALFLSPRPVLAVDRFGRALIELLLIAAAAAAMLALGVPWPVAVVYGVVAAILGYVATGPRQTR